MASPSTSPLSKLLQFGASLRQLHSNSNSQSCDTDTQGIKHLQGASQLLVILNRSTGLWRYFSGVGTLIGK